MSIDPDDQTCESCRHYRRSSFQCRRYPPQFAVSGYINGYGGRLDSTPKWPGTGRDDGCGEWDWDGRDPFVKALPLD